eukprot:CAMPEP_0181205328 /NCGR_PEP_ID=MMETSP1096-20121128/20416_1 /TAXON_ID=156174 ORGANISM="Chrysochromulina ericina, Strain CCMP281" /NCGR_SAMPLE_ID=MMETSP1096 /ASSEMBLY_ACC=CAM_ASM_000453 /LENGTH=99 /DNA_ID=CAMNT_0023296099 /DNA_START=610 /DNA_END=909 /DNA_ORIENTATION=+
MGRSTGVPVKLSVDDTSLRTLYMVVVVTLLIEPKKPKPWCLYGHFLWIFFLTEGARAEEKGRLVGSASVRALLPDPRATPCTPRMKPNAAARKNGTVAA